jgi:hypothetical protein
VLPAVWLCAAALVSRLPTRLLRIAVVLMICSYNLANGLARDYVQTEVPLDRAMADVYQAQPDSNLRTYFDLRSVIDNVYYRPLAAYQACMAAQLRPTPAEFRTGRTWPYQWGRVAAEFKNSCVYNPSIDARAIRRDMAANPKVSRVIVWEVVRSGLPDWQFGDAAVEGLGNGWSVASDEKITVHWYWTWADEWVFHRREFQRKSAPN